MSTQPIRRPGLPRLRRSWSLAPQVLSNLLFAFAILFVVTGAVTLYISPLPQTLEGWHLVVLVVGWALAWGGSTLFLRRRLAHVDSYLLPITAMLTGWGLILQARLAPALILKQVAWLVLGCAAMCTITVIPTLTRLLRRYRYTLLTAGFVLLGATLVFGVNPSGLGQELWLGAFGIYLQPSEPLKLLLVIYLAAYLADKREVPQEAPERERRAEPMWMAVVGPMAAMVGVALLLLGWQQDLGAALLFYLTFVTMLYLAWGKGWYVLLSVVLFMPIALAGYYLSSRVALRISIWLDPWAPEQADRAFQILQSLFAFSAGGLFGQGLGQGSPGFIPAVHTDFVYAALVEEFGLVGAVGFIFLIAAYTFRGIRLAQGTEAPFEALLAGGIAALIAIQTWVIAGGNAKLIPITGVTLPFLSYGGSSLVTMLVATGLLLNLSTPHPPPLTLSLAPEAYKPVRDTAARLGRSLLLLLGTIAVGSGVWAVARADELRTYLSNPRYILAESRIQRGAILDRNATALAETEVDDDRFATRLYPVPAAAPVVGYATLEYGTEGIEAACDARLRGEINRTTWDIVRQGLLHEDLVGRNVRLTVDARLQQRAQELLEGEVGALVLLDTRTGEVLALASSPIYNSATVVESWELLSEAPNSPFLNRATQGLAQPGSILQPLVMGFAWTSNANLAPAEPITTPVTFDGTTLVCRRQPEQATWQAALAQACPYPFAAAAQEIDAETFVKRLDQWGLLDPPDLTLPTVAADVDPSALDPAAEALGQGELLVTPLQMAAAIATLGNDGLRPDLRILADPYEGCALTPTEARGITEGTRVISPELAEQMVQSLPTFDGIAGHIGSSLAGPERRQAWFVGLNSPDVPRYGITVFLDHTDSPQRAAVIGRELLRLVLDLQQ